MASQNDRISQFFDKDLSQAPARSAVTLHRDGPIGEDLIKRFDITKGMNAAKCTKVIGDAIIGDLRAQSGPVKYVIRTMPSTQETVGSITIPARGMADRDADGGTKDGPNNAMARIVERAMEQSLDHHRQAFDQVIAVANERGTDNAVKDSIIDELRAELKEASDTVRDLVIHTKISKQEGVNVVDAAKANMFNAVATNIGEVPGMVKALVGKKDVKSTPVSPAAIKAFREACSELSDESITAAIKTIAADYASAAFAVTQTFTEKERDRLKPSIATILGQDPPAPNPAAN